MRLRLALLFAFALLYLSTFYPLFIINVYQARDIHRAYDLLSGQWIWHGPELQGGGTTPGPFYYWMLAAPLAVFGRWESLIWLELILAAVAAAGIWAFATIRFSPTSGWLAYFFFLNSSSVLQLLSYFWNPSFILVFFVIALFLFSSPDRPRRLRLGAFLAGLGVQLHYSMLIFFLGALVAVRRARMLPPLLGAFAIPLLPYWVWKLFSSESDSMRSLSLGVALLFRPVTSLLGGSAAEALSRIAVETPRFIQAHLWPDLTKTLGLALFLWLVGLTGDLRRKGSFLPRDRFLWASLGISSLLLLSVMYDSQFKRYVVPFLLLFHLFAACAATEVEKRHPRLFFGALAALITINLALLRHVSIGWRELAMTPLLLGLVSMTGPKYRSNAKTKAVVAGLLGVTLLNTGTLSSRYGHRSGDPRSAIAETAQFARSAIEFAGWDYNYFRKHAYLGNVEPAEDVSIVYEQEFRKARPGFPPDPKPDGVLAIHSDVAPGSSFAWESLKGSVPEEILAAARSGKLDCVKTEQVGHFSVCFYRFKVGPVLAWNNLGYPYGTSGASFGRPAEPSGAKTLGDGRGLLHFNACKTLEPACTIWFELQLLPHRMLRIAAFGDPIASQFTVNPAWTVSLEEPTLEVDCGNALSSHRIVSRLGTPLIQGPFFLAPFENQIQIPCQRPKRLSIVASKGLSDRSSRPVELAPFRIDWPLAWPR